MKRVLSVLLIGTLSTLLLGIENISWAQADPIRQALSTLRRGSTVEIERSNGTKFYAVIEEIGPDSISVMRDEGGRTLTETIPLADVTSIKAVSVKQVAHNHRTLIVASIVAGVLVIALVGACASASSDVRPVPGT
jgi:hypothetical protein